MSAWTRKCPLDVECFECFECKAQPGKWCVNEKGERRKDGYHRSRRHLANTGDAEAAKVIAGSGNQIVAKMRKYHERKRRERGAA